MYDVQMSFSSLKFIQSVIKLGQLVQKLKGNTDAHTHTHTHTHTHAYNTLVLWIFAYVNEMKLGKKYPD